MAAPKTTWQRKVQALLDERRISRRAFAQHVGRPTRTVAAWLDGTNEPLRESAVVAQFAAALGVPPDWLLDGKEGPPPAVPVPSDLQDLARAVPTKYRRLAFALADPATADWLLAQLDLLERARKTGR